MNYDSEASFGTSGFRGTFVLPRGKSIVGQLPLDEVKTDLCVNTESFLSRITDDACNKGIAYAAKSYVVTHAISQTACTNEALVRSSAKLT